MRAACALALVTLLAGCAQSVEISHVHGIAVQGDRILLATHNGLAQGEPSGASWSWSMVGEERYDLMGFVADAEREGVLYASGHPDDVRKFGGVHLGLRRSLDGGITWEQRSLRGEVDFHALTSLPGQEGWLAGSWRAAVLESRDGGLTWKEHTGPSKQVLALAASSTHVVAGTVDGLFVAPVGDLGAWTKMQTQGLPALVSSLATSRDGTVLLASTGDGRQGASYRSLDSGASWQRLQEGLLHDAAPVLFAIDTADAMRVVASTAHAVVAESRDQGDSWVVLRRS